MVLQWTWQIFWDEEQLTRMHSTRVDNSFHLLLTLYSSVDYICSITICPTMTLSERIDAKPSWPSWRYPWRTIFFLHLPLSDKLLTEWWFCSLLEALVQKLFSLPAQSSSTSHTETGTGTHWFPFVPLLQSQWWHQGGSGRLLAAEGPSLGFCCRWY